MSKGVFYASFVIILTVISIMLSVSAHAASPDDYRPRWYQSWEGTRTGILGTFWDQINFWDIDEGYDPRESADYLGWYQNTGFDVQNWEREVCIMDLSTDVRNIRSSSTDPSANSTYTTTVSISAKKNFGIDTSLLYEVSFYIRPFTSDAEYKVYLYNSATPQDKTFIVGTRTTSKRVGLGKSAGGYEARYIDGVFDKAAIEFTEQGFMQNLEATIK